MIGLHILYIFAYFTENVEMYVCLKNLFFITLYWTYFRVNIKFQIYIILYKLVSILYKLQKS